MLKAFALRSTASNYVRVKWDSKLRQRLYNDYKGRSEAEIATLRDERERMSMSLKARDSWQ
jgi:hypothetical protein